MLHRKTNVFLKNYYMNPSIILSFVAEKYCHTPPIPLNERQRDFRVQNERCVFLSDKPPFGGLNFLYKRNHFCM